jgi:hypothetical protein
MHLDSHRFPSPLPASHSCTWSARLTFCSCKPGGKTEDTHYYRDDDPVASSLLLSLLFSFLFDRLFPFFFLMCLFQSCVRLFVDCGVRLLLLLLLFLLLFFFCNVFFPFAFRWWMSSLLLPGGEGRGGEGGAR